MSLGISGTEGGILCCRHSGMEAILWCRTCIACCWQPSKQSSLLSGGLSGSFSLINESLVLKGLAVGGFFCFIWLLGPQNSWQSSWYPGLFLGGGVSGVCGCDEAQGVSETGSFTSNKLGVGGMMLPLRNGWANFHLFFLTGAKGQLLCTTFLDFFDKTCTPKMQVKGPLSELPIALDFGSKHTKTL